MQGGRPAPSPLCLCCHYGLLAYNHLLCWTGLGAALPLGLVLLGMLAARHDGSSQAQATLWPPCVLRCSSTAYSACIHQPPSVSGCLLLPHAWCLSALHGLLLSRLPLSPPLGEDVSGMPAFCRPWTEGGVGFDYRLQVDGSGRRGAWGLNTAADGCLAAWLPACLPAWLAVWLSVWLAGWVMQPGEASLSPKEQTCTTGCGPPYWIWAT